MSKPLRDSIQERISSFQVGDRIDALVYPAREVEGEIIELHGNGLATISVGQEDLLVMLTLARKLEE